MLRSYIIRFGIFAGVVLTVNLHAQDAGTAFLLHPESTLIAMTLGQDEATLAPKVDGSMLSFTAPQILIHKNSDQAEFISAVWKDASGQPVHQRDVFVVKPDYGVVVDYVYGKGRHTIFRYFRFPSGKPSSDANGAQTSLADGKSFRVQAMDGASASIQGNAPKTESMAVPDSEKIVNFHATINTPAPIATVLLGWTGAAAPKVEPVKPANPMIVKFNVTFPDGRVDEIAVAWEARPLHLSGKEFKGWAACLRQGPAGTSSIEIN